MQKVDVQMSPKPYDTKRLFCSQGDTELRKFGFRLMDGLNEVDTSNISDPVFTSFPVEVGGTEELLPTNTGNPTTSPILADIQYPDGLREDESFTYRESPTTVDGKAKVKVLKGNTLVWNQLVQNGDFSNGITHWNRIISSTTVSVSNNECTVTPSERNGGLRNELANKPFATGHSYLFVVTVKADSERILSIGIGDNRYFTNVQNINVTTAYKIFAEVFTITTDASTTTQQIAIIRDQNTSGFVSFYVKNAMLIDLTTMGISSDQFLSYFPLPYYQYDSGSLLSFNGTGIKTTGFNQWDEEWLMGFISTSDGQAHSGFSGAIMSKNFNRCLPNTNYHFTCGVNDVPYLFWYDADQNFISYNAMGGVASILSPSNAYYFKIRRDGSDTYNNDICINISSSRNGEYEPYTESTASLPTLTYFPTGMKSAGSVRDELSDNKATTRVGQVDLGTLDWAMPVSGRFQSTGLNGLIAQYTTTESPNITCSKYVTFTANMTSQVTSGITAFTDSGTSYIRAIDSAYSTADAFKTAMSGVYLNYELATESEQSIMSASLVTENAEIPLYVSDDMLVGDCTEELSASAGILDAKIKFTDADGDCYSNKLKISVEARP